MMKSAVWTQLYWGSASVFLCCPQSQGLLANLLHSIYHLLHQVALLTPDSYMVLQNYQLSTNYDACTELEYMVKDRTKSPMTSHC